MSLKKLIYINTIGIFGLCFLTHFLYTWFPNPIFAIFFPVNESIWEHMKMLFTTTIFYGIIPYVLLKKHQIKHHNFLLSLLLISLLSILIYLILFLPVYTYLGENMLFIFTLLLFVIGLCQYIGYKFLMIGEIKYQNIISITGIVIVCIIMGYLSYRPPRTHLFFDTENEKYGLHYFLLK